MTMNDDTLDKFQVFFLILLAFSLPISITLPETFYFLAFVVWLTKMVVYKKPFRHTKLEIPIIVLAIGCISAILFSPSPLQSARIAKKLVKFGLIFLLANNLDSEAGKSRVIDAWFLGAIIASAWIVIEYLRGIRREDLGFFGCISFGYFAPMFLGISLSLIGLKNYKRTSILSALTLIAGVFTLFLSSTRGGWIAFLAGLTLFFIIKRKWFSLATSVSVLVLMVSILSIYLPNSEPGKAVISLLRPFDKQVPRVVGSNLARWYKWKASWQMFKEHPFFGIGPYRFGEELPNYASEEVQAEIFKHQYYGNAHSIYFDYLATMGIAGFLGLLFFLFTVFRLLIWKYKSCDSTFEKNLVLGVLIAVVSFSIAGFFEQSFHRSEILLNLCFILGLVL
jgi:O-antigen ligase